MKAMHTKRNGLENHHPISHGGSLSFQIMPPKPSMHPLHAVRFYVARAKTQNSRYYVVEDYYEHYFICDFVFEIQYVQMTWNDFEILKTTNTTRHVSKVQSIVIMEARFALKAIVYLAMLRLGRPL
jgi:hypothetical protein